jgi:4-amino-4-deoxychorismate lyase
MSTASPDVTLIDGVPAALVPVADRGLHYGDGLFETVAIVDGRPCLWDRHLARLHAGCEHLGIPSPVADLLTEEALSLGHGHASAVLKVIVTRGEGGRGYRPPRPATPRRILRITPWPGYPERWRAQGVRVRYCATRLGDQPLLAGLKHLNRLEQVMARAEWDDPAIAEGLMLDLGGRVIEGTQTNVFAIENGRLLTPPLDRCGVVGVVRALVLEVARDLGMEATQEPLDAARLERAGALFLTSSLAPLWPVCELAGRPLDPARVPRELVAAVLAAAFRP